MLMDLRSGTIKINDDLIIHPQYSFEDFQKTRFYKGQDDARVIYIEEPQIIDGRKYLVDLVFHSKKIYSVSLCNIDVELLGWEDEPKRKEIHDEILIENGILNGCQYGWGNIVSACDPKSGSSTIGIFYIFEHVEIFKENSLKDILSLKRKVYKLMAANVKMIKKFDDERKVIYQFGTNENQMGEIEFDKKRKEFRVLKQVNDKRHSNQVYEEWASQQIVKILFRNNGQFPDVISVKK